MQNAQIKEFVTVRDSRMQLFPWLQRQKACGVGSLLPTRDCSEHGTYEFMKDLTPLESFTMSILQWISPSLLQVLERVQRMVTDYFLGIQTALVLAFVTVAGHWPLACNERIYVPWCNDIMDIIP
uniref:Uncharacterized protein n=1 Tax=Ditylum brightwellii TaxID=49249 RepID=A0A6U3VB61_9STRA